MAPVAPGNPGDPRTPSGPVNNYDNDQISALSSQDKNNGYNYMYYIHRPWMIGYIIICCWSALMDFRDGVLEDT